MNAVLKLNVVMLASLVITACFGPMSSRTYEKTDKNFQLLAHDSHNIDRLSPVRLRVSSQKIWQNSKVFISTVSTLFQASARKWIRVLVVVR